MTQAKPLTSIRVLNAGHGLPENSEGRRVVFTHLLRPSKEEIG